MTSTNPLYSYSSASLTHPGNARKINQDALLELPEYGIWLVADGVGGHTHGEWASRAVVEAVNMLQQNDLRSGVVEAVRTKLNEVNSQLIDLGQQAGNETIIGSTVASLVLYGNQCTCLWAGDSRIYGLRTGRLARLTRDHSEVELMVEKGELSPAEALHHPRANIIHRAIGRSSQLELDAYSYDLSAHDRFLLCTDGLTKELSDDEITELLQAKNCRDCCQHLMDAVLTRPCKDNVAIVVVDVERFVETTDTVQLFSPLNRDGS